MNFHQRLHVQFAAESNQVAQKVIVERHDHQEETVGIIGARLPNLPGIKDEILAQSRNGDFFASVAKIFQRAAEEFAFGEDRESGGASGLQGFGQGGRIEGFTNNAARRRGRLQLRDDVRASRESAAAKSRTGGAALTPYFSAVSGNTRLR